MQVLVASKLGWYIAKGGCGAWEIALCRDLGALDFGLEDE